MAQVSKITLSEDEISLLKRSDFFLTKDSATEKIMQLFVTLQEELANDIIQYPFIDKQSNTVNGKIFRGESYRKLPYVVLDYPKHFSADSILTFRTMLWWGKEFSFTLHLYGHSFDHFREKMITNISKLAGKDFFFCINSKQWEYHFEKTNYVGLDELLNSNTDLREDLQERTFVKLSRRLPIAEIDKLVDYGRETFSLLMNVLEK